jgi:hypothetical protein
LTRPQPARHHLITNADGHPDPVPCRWRKGGPLLVAGDTCQGPTGPRGIQLAPTDNPAVRACLAGYHQVLTYQPASRYWTFQGFEAAIFAGLAAALIGLSVWWVHHRLA